MSRCDRFEDALADGRPLGEGDPHLADCPDCAGAKRQYRRLEAALAEVGAEDAPPTDWREKVRLAAREEEASEPRPATSLGSRPSRWLPFGLAAAASIAAVWLVVRPPGIEPGALNLTYAEGSGPERRSAEVVPGTTVQLAAGVAADDVAEIRIYRSDRDVVLRCSTEPPCRRERRALRLDWKVEEPGSYQPVLFLDTAPPWPSLGSLDSDVGAVFDAGGDATLGEPVTVR